MRMMTIAAFNFIMLVASIDGRSTWMCGLREDQSLVTARIQLVIPNQYALPELCTEKPLIPRAWWLESNPFTWQFWPDRDSH